MKRIPRHICENINIEDRIGEKEEMLCFDKREEKRRTRKVNPRIVWTTWSLSQREDYKRKKPTGENNERREQIA